MKKTLIAISIAIGAIAIAFAINPISTDCTFCLEEVIDRQLFYRGNDILGLVTHKPAMQGHVLILPARHVERFEEMSPLELVEIGEAIKKIDAAVRRLYGTTGYILIQKNGREAGQSIPHVHFHYLPCKKGDAKIFIAIKFFMAQWFVPLNKEEMRPQILSLQNEIAKEGKDFFSL